MELTTKQIAKMLKISEGNANIYLSRAEFFKHKYPGKDLYKNGDLIFNELKKIINRRNRITEQQNKKIIEMFKKRIPKKEICSELDISYYKVQKIINNLYKELDIEIKKYAKRDISKCVSITTKRTPKQIAKLAGLSEGTAKMYLARAELSKFADEKFQYYSNSEYIVNELIRLKNSRRKNINQVKEIRKTANV